MRVTTTLPLVSLVLAWRPALRDDRASHVYMLLVFTRGTGTPFAWGAIVGRPFAQVWGTWATGTKSGSLSDEPSHALPYVFWRCVSLVLPTALARCHPAQRSLPCQSPVARTRFLWRYATCLVPIALSRLTPASTAKSGSCVVSTAHPCSCSQVRYRDDPP